MASNRYEQLIFNGKIKSFPKVTISKRLTDIYVTYDSKLTRLDRIAGEIYKDDTAYWLILLANPQYSMEFDIPAKSIIRVPFPFIDAMTEFLSKQRDNQII